MSYARVARQNWTESDSESGVRSSPSSGLRVAWPNDRFEREANRVANEITAGGYAARGWSLSRMSVTPPMQRCACGGSGGSTSECEECKAKNTLQREAAGVDGPAVAPPIVHDVLSSPGRPLDRATRNFFEPRFGRDLSNVRIHADDRASESARSVNAHAYTVNQHVVFGAGRYQPGHNEGRRLLAHELAHTVQQGGVSSAPVSHGGLTVGATNDNFERQAGAVAERMGKNNAQPDHSQSSNLGGIPRTVLQRDGDKYANLTIAQLRKLLETDPEAAEALRLRFRAMTNVQLERYARTDPMAQSVYAQRNVVPKQAGGQGSFSNREVQSALEQDLQQQRAASVARRTSSSVTPGIKTEGGTIGTAKTDIPGLENRTFVGRSPQAGGQVNPASKFPPATDPEVLPHTYGHAEQHIADQLEEVLKSIPREQLKGRHVWMVIEQEPCSTCAQGITDPAEAAGVLRKLSAEFPEITFEVKSLTSSAVMVLKGGARTNVRGVSSAPENAPAEKGPSPKSVEVGTKIEVTNTVKNADGSTVSEVEYNFGQNLKQINEGAPAGAEIPSRIAVRVTQNSEGVITSVESLSGQPQALVDALAQRTLAPGLAGEAGGAAQGAAAGARRAALLFKGLKIGGWAAFGIITGYQLYKATPAQRPRVLAGAGGGLAGGIATTYLVCNLALDIETAGWGLVICGFIAGGAGGVAGSKLAEDAYDEATATDLDRALHQLDGKDPNERTVFNIIVGKLGDTSNCIDANFVNNFISTIPPHLQDSETVLLAAQLAAAAIAPPSSARSTEKPPKQKGTECPGCHGRSQESLQPSFQRLDRMSYEAILAAPTCSSILGAALSALKTAVGQLPRYYRAPGDISHHPEPGTSTVTPRPTRDPNAIPSEKQQIGTGNCPGGCHTPSGGEKSLIDAKKPATDAERTTMMNWLQSQMKPAATGNAHATPPGVKLPAPQGFPSVEEQQGHQPAHKDDKLGGLSSFGTGSNGEMTDADRQKLIDFVIAGKK